MTVKMFFKRKIDELGIMYVPAVQIDLQVETTVHLNFEPSNLLV
jgi:hypothetical protein